MQKSIYILVTALALFSTGNLFAESRDSAGKIISHGKVETIDRSDSSIYLFGKMLPVEIVRKTRLRDNAVKQEHIRLKNDSKYKEIKTQIWVESPPNHYSENVTDLFNDKEWVTKMSRKRLRGLEVIAEAKESSNKTGKFTYLIAANDSETPDKCIFAMQLANEATVSRPGKYYQDSIMFLYCRPNTTEQELLQYFSLVRIKER